MAGYRPQLLRVDYEAGGLRSSASEQGTHWCSTGQCGIRRAHGCL